VRSYVEGAGGCRGAVLDGYLDRRETERRGCEAGEERCDVCRGEEKEEEEEEEEEGEEAEEEEGEEAEEEEGEEAEEEEGEEVSNQEASDQEASNQEAIDAGESEAEDERRTFAQQQRERQGPQQVWIQQRQQEFGDVEWLRQQLAWWANRCGICEAKGVQYSNHNIRQCWQQESREVQVAIQHQEESIQFERYSGCFWCGVPQEICHRWESNSQGRYQRVEDGDCQYKGVLIGGLLGIVFGYNEIGRQWYAQLEAIGVDREWPGRTVADYLGKKRVLETVEQSVS
jgi:hypothetical protein